MFLFEEEERKRRTISKAERDMLFKRQNGRCMYCGKREREVTYFDVDHKTPFSRDGRESISNLQLLCRPCNTRKGDMTDGEFRRRFKLTPSRQAKGPPTKAIPQKYFEGIAADIAKKKTQRRKSNDDDDWEWPW